MSSSLLNNNEHAHREHLTNAITRWLWRNSFNGLDFDELARSLNMSPRSLRRHLQHHGLSYKSIVTAERKNFAASLLKERKHSFHTIGKQLGYQDASSFSRAFKGWYGISPTSFQSRIEDDNIAIKRS